MEQTFSAAASLVLLSGAQALPPKLCIICKHMDVQTHLWHKQKESVTLSSQMVAPVPSCPNGIVTATHAPLNDIMAANKDHSAQLHLHQALQAIIQACINYSMQTADICNYLCSSSYYSLPLSMASIFLPLCI